MIYLQINNTIYNNYGSVHIDETTIVVDNFGNRGYKSAITIPLTQNPIECIIAHNCLNKRDGQG